MLDVRADINDLWRASGHLSRSKGGRALMFISARSAEGTSSVAASFSLMTAERAQRATWLVDLGIHDNSQFSAFEKGFATDTGIPGRAYDASLGVLPIFDVLSPGEKIANTQVRTGKLLTAHQISGTRLLVTKFRMDRLSFGQKVTLSSRGDWWGKLRRAADWIVVDAPALETSKGALRVVPHMDGVVIVVRSDTTCLLYTSDAADE